MTQPARIEKPVAEMSEDEFDAWMEALPPAPGLLSSRGDTAARIARARDDVAAGRCFPHALVGEWLKTWSSPDYLPFEEWLTHRNG